MRVYLLFVSGVCGLAGMAIVSNFNFDIKTFLMTFLPLFLAYGFGQALTDCFQVDTDSISAPYRPLCRKEVSPLSVGLISFLGLSILVSSLIYINFYNLIWGILSIIGLVSYTYFKKNYWFAGPFYNGWIVMLLPVMGYMSASGANLKELNNNKLLLLLMLTLFSYANFVLIGYLKDISADRATSYKTFPVVFGWNKTIFAGSLFVILSLLSCFLLIGFGEPISFSVFILATIIALSGLFIGYFTKQKIEKNAAFPIASTVRSLILWQIAVAIHYQPNWLWFSLIYYLCFELALYLRPEKDQI
jgi:4-hydroxybenzoate polyprenyltransferase